MSLSTLSVPTFRSSTYDYHYAVAWMQAKERVPLMWILSTWSSIKSWTHLPVCEKPERASTSPCTPPHARQDKGWLQLKHFNFPSCDFLSLSIAITLQNLFCPFTPGWLATSSTRTWEHLTCADLPSSSSIRLLSWIAAFNSKFHKARVHRSSR